MKHTAYIIALFLLVSCKPLMRKMYQIKDPGIESKASILKKALRYGIDTSGILTVNAADFLTTLSAQSLPDIAIFDSSGAYIEYRSTDSACNSGLFDFIPALHPNGVYRKTGKTNLHKELQKLRDIDGNVIATSDEKADFVLLIYWSVWLGKLNKDHVKVWEQLARQNKQCNIKVLKVNLDIQAFWPQETKTFILQSIRKPK